MTQKVYFIGIGGIGMSALAQFLKHEGAIVAGSDRENSPVTDMLEQKGITVMVPQKTENVPKDSDVIIYSDAVEEDNPERAAARELGITEYSYFQMLGRVSAPKKTVAVAGTHGKTTTTGMLTKILIDAGMAPTAIIGSIVKDFGSNYVAGSSDLFVVEACEYHDHLLELSPDILVINNLEWDHTDWFTSLAALQETFKKAVAKVPESGSIITNLNDPNVAAVLTGTVARVVDYTKESAYELLLAGQFNQMNARAAAAAARAVSPELSDTAIADSLASFHGIWRRFEYKGKTKNGADVYDDYAHHPTEIRATLEALREKARGKIFAIFQPHLFSRTRDLLDDFAKAFSDADDVIVAPIYAAREHDDGTISNHTLAERISVGGTHARALDSFDDIAAYLQSHTKEGDTIITMGAGDIYKLSI